MTAAPPRARRRFTASSAEPWALVGLVAVAVAVVFGNGPGQFFSDAQPSLYLDPVRSLRTALSAWLPSPYVGAPNYQSGLAPAALVSTALSWLHVPPAVMSRPIRVLLLVVAGAGARSLYRELLDPVSVRGRTAAAVLYVANPYVIVTAAALAVMQPLAGLPWLLLFLSRALRGQRTARHVALTTLVFFAMGGENAGVVPLMMLGASVPALAVDALVNRRIQLRALVGRGLACIGALLAVSAYWILPSLSAVGTGSAVAGGTETPSIIYSTSSFAEVLRGLGGWPLYGRDSLGPFQPEFVLYITRPGVIIATFAGVVLGLLGAVRGPRRRLVPLVMVVTGLVVAAGAFPYRSPALYGRLWLWTMTHVPGAIALRTGVKAGGAIVLGLALLGALAVRTYTTRDAEETPLSGRLLRAATGTVLAAGLVVSALPMLNGRLFDRSFVIPDYWRAAAARLDAGDPSARVLVLPGQKLFSYRWRRPSADDPLAGLTTRRLAIRTSTPTSTPAAVNFLAAIDQPLQRGTQRVSAVSAMSRYLGADQVLLRSDIVWEHSDAARPAELFRQLAADPGLVVDGTAGQLGRNTAAGPSVPPSTDDQVERGLAPVQFYRVQDPQPLVRSSSTDDGLLVVGDNASVPALVDLGYLDGRRPYYLAGALTPEQVTPVLGSVSAVVLTDSNQRRQTSVSRLSNGSGPLLAQETDPDATEALFGVDDQTVLETAGGTRISASGSGSIFGPVPFGSPALAFDGDPSTGWTAGDFGKAVGQSLTLGFAQPRTVSHLRIVALDSSPVSLTRVGVTVDGVEHEVDLGATGIGELAIAPTATRSLTVTLTGVDGVGDNAVGIAEIEIAGVDVSVQSRLPRTLNRVASTPADRARLAALPLDVLLQRDRGLNLEGRLRRGFELPDSRSFSLVAEAAINRSLADPLIDRLVGTGGAVVTSSGRLFGDPRLRGSQAFDGDGRTVWVGNGPEPWVEATFDPRLLRSVTVTPAEGLVDGTRLVAPQAVRLTFSDGTSVERPVGSGSTTVTFPVRRSSSVRVALLPPGADQVAGLSSVDLGPESGLVTPGSLPAEDRCVDLLSLDGHAVPMRTTGAAGDVEAGTVTTYVSCRPAMTLGAGKHAVVAEPQWLVDRVRFRGAASTAPADPTRGSAGPLPSVKVLASSSTSYSVAVGPSSKDSMLVVGEAFDARWSARLGSRSLGAPVLVNGYSLGWRIPAGSGGLVSVSYAPQRTLLAGLVLTALALVGAGLTVALRRDRRREPVRRREGPSRRWSVAQRAGAMGVAGLLVYVAGGPVVLLVAAGVGLGMAPWIAHWSGRAALAGVGLVALAPIGFLMGNLGRIGVVTPDLVRGNLLPHVLVGSGVGVLAVAIAVEVLGSRPEAERATEPGSLHEGGARASRG